MMKKSLILALLEPLLLYHCLARGQLAKNATS